MRVDVVRLEHAADLPLPVYATEGSAGMDVHAAVTDNVDIAPGGIVMIPTGLQMAVPRGFECQVRSRSGLAAKHGVFALNAPGTIDSDFRGEVHIILANMSATPFSVSRGMRIAQLVVARYEQVEWCESESLMDTQRGSGGFGSTGVGVHAELRGE